MRYTIIVLALLGVLASPRPAAASGNDLLVDCIRYVMGWRDAFMIETTFSYGTKYLEQNPKLGICIPKGGCKTAKWRRSF